ncbi:hypothetical protein ACH5RR_021340 [Cinchona calisaya]|uniref:Uncharacterized protein n=1 Tax=Cinchona calisaya TaxID=153742 RepID=A0ABD2ZH04_9GENT
MITNARIEVDKFSKDFIIGSFQAIVKLMTSSSDLSELLKSREDVSKHLMRLNGVVLDGGTRRTVVNWLAERDLNSQLQESHEQMQGLESRKAVLLKEEARIHVEKLQVEDRCGTLASRIATLEESLDQGKKDEQLIRSDICEDGQEKIRALKDLIKQFQDVFASLDSFMQID